MHGRREASFGEESGTLSRRRLLVRVEQAAAWRRPERLSFALLLFTFAWTVIVVQRST